MIIILHGEDTFRSIEKLNEFKKKFLKEVDPMGINLIELEIEKLNFNSFKEKIESIPLGTSKRMFIIKNFFSEIKNDQQEKISSLLEKEIIVKNTIIIFWEGKSIKENKNFNNFKKFFLTESKDFQKNFYAFEFSPLKDKELQKWIIKRLIMHKGKIASRALNLLTESVGPDLWQQEEEIKKLVSFKKREAIDIDDVKLLVVSQKISTIFDLISAIEQKNKKRALSILKELFLKGKHPLEILQMLIRYWRNIVILRELYRKNPKADFLHLAELSGLHPYEVKKMLSFVKQINFSEIEKNYKNLLNLDLKIKRSKISPQILMELFIESV